MAVDDSEEEEAEEEEEEDLSSVGGDGMKGMGGSMSMDVGGEEKGV